MKSSKNNIYLVQCNLENLETLRIKALYFFKLIFIGVYLLIYNVVLVSAVQQIQSIIHIHISTLFRFYSHIGHYIV